MSNNQRDVAGPLLVGGGLLYWWQTGQPLALAPYEFKPWVDIAFWVAGGACALMALAAIAPVVAEFISFVRSKWPRTSHGQAGWMGKREMRAANMFRRKGYFIGASYGRGLWYDCPSHVLMVAPSRAGKTTSGIIPQLVFNRTSCIVTDIKGELYEQTARYRREMFLHRIIGLNMPARVGAPEAHYNVCQIVLDSLKDRPGVAIADARAIAGQLYRESPGGEREPLWREGSVSVLTIIIIGLAVLEPEDCNLVEVNKYANDLKALEDLCTVLSQNRALNGDVATLALGVLAQMAKSPKQFQSFMTGALLAVSGYTESSDLGRISKRCSFRFSDTKRGKVSIYMGADSTRPDEIKSGPGLWNWAAMTEIQREGTPNRVRMYVDEAYQFKIQNLAATLMGSTSYGLRCMLVFQSLASIDEVYGEKAASSIKGQCALQLFFGINDWDEADKVSRALGQRTHSVSSFGLRDDINENVSGHGQPLMSAEEIRRMPRDQMLVFTSGNRAARIYKVGYQEMVPVRGQVDVNRLESDRRYIGKTKLLVWRLWPSGIGTWRVWGHPVAADVGGRRKVPWLSIVWRLIVDIIKLFGGTKPAPVLLAAGIAMVVFWGVPHVRYEQTGVVCRYVGLEVIERRDWNCPIIIFRKYT